MSEPSSAQQMDGFALSIGSFTLRIQSSHHRLVEVLKLRYAEFPPHGTPFLSARIELLGTERRSSLLDTRTDFKDGILQFSAPGYRGFINEKTREANLQLSSAQPVEDIDYFLRVMLALAIHQAGGILMHTAGIVRNGAAYLFFGHSGSGKTTVSQATAAIQPSGSQVQDTFTILNDDLVLLLPQGENWTAFGTPFWNPTQIKPANLNAPVTALYLLIQDTRVFTQKLPPGKATASLFANVPVIPQDAARSLYLLELLARLQKNVPVYELHFLPDDSFWNVIPY